MKAWPECVTSLRGCSAGLALILSFQTKALAQDQGTVDAVVMYAQKRAAPLQDAPMSVSTLPDIDLANAGIVNLEGVATDMPTVDMQRSVNSITTTNVDVGKANFNGSLNLGYSGLLFNVMGVF